MEALAGDHGPDWSAVPGDLVRWRVLTLSDPETLDRPGPAVPDGTSLPVEVLGGDRQRSYSYGPAGTHRAPDWFGG